MTNEELSDTDLLNETLEGGDAVEQQVEQASEQQTETQETAQTEQQQSETQQQQQQVDDNAPQVPSWRLREINEEKRRLAEENERVKAELAQIRAAQQRQQPQQAEQKDDDIDPLLDPKGYAKKVREEIRNELLAERREESLQNAAEKYKEEFAEAYKAAQEKVDPALKARMQQSRNPGETLIQWHREQKTMKEVGNDPNAWLEKKLEERLNDPAFLAKALERAQGAARQAPQSNGRPRVDLPPSISGASRASAALRSQDNEEVPDRELFNQIAG